MIDSTDTLASCVRDAACLTDLIVFNGGLGIFHSAYLQQAISEMIVRPRHPGRRCTRALLRIRSGGDALIA